MFIKTESNNAYQTPSDLNRWSRRMTLFLLALPRFAKCSILFGIDFSVAVLCLVAALELRQGYVDDQIGLTVLAFYALIPVVSLYLIGFYRGASRGFFDAAMGRVLQLFLLLIIVYQFIIYVNPVSTMPRSAPIIFLFLFFIWLWNSRLMIRGLLNRLQKPDNQSSLDSCCDNVIIYGAGSAGRELLESLRHSHKYNVVAYIDDDPQLIGAYLHGKKIYAAHALPWLIEKLNVAQVILAIPSMSRGRKKQIMDSLSGVSVKLKDLPSLRELADEIVTVSHIRPVDILDVLERETVEPVAELLQKNITGKNVLVTGAGGSIGSELCRQIMKNKPLCLVLYEQSEYALYTIDQELRKQKADDSEYQNIEIISIIGSVANEKKLINIFEKYHIKTIYHAAAYKHVPIVESNPFEGTINNTKGTYHCACAAIKAHVDTFVLISTDKAVRPTNVMGASKRLAELVCQGLSQSNSHTCFSMVRFGNVLGSSGSVVPLFTKQIEQGGPITITHPDITRYFMTIPEAASLVIQAGAMAFGGEVFVLDMGAPVKIVDLAKRMIRLTGCELKDASNPNGDIEIVFTGLRPGEKLYEELIIGADNIETTFHPLIMQAMEHSFPLEDIEKILFESIERAKQQDILWLKTQFRSFVEGYREGPNTEIEKVDIEIIDEVG
ncbi:nucleoside-diphosphate sugar epimerase/dehydratase [Psychrobacter sp. Ps2]|uniref:polysaccharide biosynthesis protein n=1 Tax=Psychrobacter sp. Ps2 TaxID=2790956 RepID=UPI001EDE8F96|nr:nucleoside-diphosphate sugar epimerase/dehydratase [Psychrobacter sp. Ps2]MCG3859945.1 polysaccharide biosynthesis protein [Psychrobacter sp. Ps2]